MLAGDEFNTIRVVSADVYKQCVAARGPGMVKLLPSTFAFTVKPKSGRKKGRFCGCEMRKWGKADATKSPTAAVCSVRWHGILCIIYRMQTKQIDAKKAYCRGSRDKDEPSIFLRLPSAWKMMGYPMFDPQGRPLLIEVIGNLYGTQRAGRIFWEFMR